MNDRSYIFTIIILSQNFRYTHIGLNHLNRLQPENDVISDKNPSHFIQNIRIRITKIPIFATFSMHFPLKGTRLYYLIYR